MYQNSCRKRKIEQKNMFRWIFLKNGLRYEFLFINNSNIIFVLPIHAKKQKRSICIINENIIYMRVKMKRFYITCKFFLVFSKIHIRKNNYSKSIIYGILDSKNLKVYKHNQTYNIKRK